MTERVRRNGKWFVQRIIPLGFVFAVVYGVTNSLAGMRGATNLVLAWEQHLPFMPWSILAYLSIFLVFWLPLFVMEREAVADLMKRYLLVTICAGAVFLAFPTAVGLERPDPSTLPFVFEWLYSMDAPYNAAPSLHVAYAVLILPACARSLEGMPRAAVLLWLLLIVASAWVTHQHQFVDILSGALLGGLSSLGSGAGAGSAAGSMPKRHIRKYWRA
ncbi:MAG TPA: phosphatase PAP2 family protein [Burkholderiales bacterium]|nr:phosphatase PAP2 family protein [Burkholderiales bacterium]HXV09543.1 phosphatase PAP2 family protein [Burkholderiales bacterium]